MKGGGENNFTLCEVYQTHLWITLNFILVLLVIASGA